LNQVKRVRIGSIYGIIGVLNVSGSNYLGVITKALKVAKLNGSSIYRVVEVKFISFNDGVPTPSASVYMLDEVKKLFEDGFYFSYSYDLTCCRQRRVKWIESKKSDPIELIASDRRYFWNWHLS